MPSDNGLTASTRAYQGATSWYRDDLYLPSGFQPTRNTNWNFFYEIHNYPDSPGDAMIALGVDMDTQDGCGAANEGRLSTEIQGGSTSTPTYGWICGPSWQANHWYDIVYEIHWDYQSTGWVKEWLDGRLLGTYNGPTLYYFTSLNGPGQGYLQHGFYRPTDARAGYAQPDDYVYHAATMVGPTAASIGENLP